MLRSDDRILTTHTGSLPRPAALTALYVRRSRGEAIDAAELDRVGKAAVHEVVAKQIAAGVDVPNNGEQQREAFFLYVRHRMSGFGGGWTRRVFADVTHYPAFMAWKAAHDAVNESISNLGGVPEAIGEVRYLDRAPVEAECADFRAALDAARGGFAEPFMTAPSPGIVAAAMRNAYYDTEDAYLAALGRALQVEYETIVSTRLRAADRRAGPRDGAAHLLSGPPAGRLPRLRRTCGGDDQRRARQRAARDRCVCMSAGATTRARTTATWRCPKCCRPSVRRRSAASCCRSPIRATRTSTAA